MAPPWQMPKRRGRLGGWTGNPLAHGVISVFLAGVLSFSVARWQSEYAAKQATAGQQAAVAVQLETAATTFFEDTRALYASRATDCETLTHNHCLLPPPSDSTFIDDEDVLYADRLNISDPKASALTGQLLGSAQSLLLSVGDSGREQTAFEGQRGAAYDELVTRC